MNSRPLYDSFKRQEHNPRFKNTNKVVWMSFYLRTIVKTYFLHLKARLPNLSPGLDEIILIFLKRILNGMSITGYTSVQINHLQRLYTLYSIICFLVFSLISNVSVLCIQSFVSEFLVLFCRHKRLLSTEMLK